jgi:hypothetical protein
MLDGLSCSLTFKSFLTISCSFTLICVFRSIMLDGLSCILLKTQIKVKEQHVVRNDMDVNVHERLSNITLRHKLK